jgi:hypothetical protein
VVIIESDRDCAAGKQLFEAYGESNNIFLAEWFGFVPQANPSDVLRSVSLVVVCLSFGGCRLKWKFKPGEGESHAEKLSMLNMFAGAIQVEFKVRIVPQLPTAVLHYLQLTTLPMARAKQCSQAGSKRALIDCISDHHPLGLYDELESVVRERLAEFSTTLEQDEEILKGADAKERGKRLAIEHRMHQKKIGHHVLSLIAQLKSASPKSEL